jgi:thiol-disulfide isomerase/thioredoxin
MNRILLGIFILFGVFWLFRELKPAARFNKAENTLQVDRLAKDGSVVREEFQPRQAPYLAVYHGAGWCQPCQRFSPVLAEFYHDADKTRGRFQLVMVDYDQSRDDMIGYMREHRMEFPALRRGEAGAWGESTGSGIPNLIIIDTVTGKVVSSSFDGATYVGCEQPLSVLRTIVAQGHP